MRIAILLGALGILGSMTAAPAPALSQGAYIQGPGFGVDVGRPRYRERYYGPERGYAYDRRGGCRTVTIERDNGSVRRIRRCD
jgi:hypothetical protein